MVAGKKEPLSVMQMFMIKKTFGRGILLIYPAKSNILSF